METYFRHGFQIFLLFLILQFFGPALALLEILPLNIGLVWPAFSALFASYFTIQTIKPETDKDVWWTSFFAWTMISMLNATNYHFLGLVLVSLSPLTVLPLVLSLVYSLLFVLSGSYLGRAVAE